MINSLLKRAITLHNQGNILSAQKLYQQILIKEPDNAHALHFSGLIAADKGQLDTAQSHLEKSLAIQPNNAVFHHNCAGFLSRQGNITKAIDHFKLAIKLKPSYAEAYQGLTECTSFPNDTSLLTQIITQLKNKHLSKLDKSYFHFAAAKILADSQDYDTAFHHYLLANKFKGAVFNQQAYQTELKQQIETFTPTFVQSHKEWGLYSHTPIFVLGMPRSGTTLIEQVLASHSSVFGAGELNDISTIARLLPNKTTSKLPYPECLKTINQLDLAGFGIEYLSQLNKISDSAERVVNKHPLNFKHIGLILLMFPNAKIIHSVRDPIDSCLSCFFQNFTKGQEYSFNLEDLGDFYIGYQQIMSHWKTIFPNKIYDVHYENMIANQDETTRKLLDYCDLQWQDNCLSFHQTDRAVMTASKYQVRQPIYTSSVKKWERYEQHLHPLLNKLKLG